MGARGEGFYTYESELDDEQKRLLEEAEKYQEEILAKDRFSLSEFANVFRLEATFQGQPEKLQNKTDMEIYQMAESRGNPLTERVIKGDWTDLSSYTTVDIPEGGVSYPLSDISLPPGTHERLYRWKNDIAYKWPAMAKNTLNFMKDWVGIHNKEEFLNKYR